MSLAVAVAVPSEMGESGVIFETSYKMEVFTQPQNLYEEIVKIP